MGTLVGAAKTGSARAKREAKAANDFITALELGKASYDEKLLGYGEQGGFIYNYIVDK